MTINDAMKQNNIELKFNFLKDMHEKFQGYVKNIHFDNKNSLQFSLISLYGSIMEFTTSCIFLIDSKIMISIPVLIRTMLEANIDLINLILDSKYILLLDFDF